VRARAEEAERQGNERKAQLLHGKPAAGKAGMTTTLRRVTPPPQQQQLRSTPPPLAGRPPTHPASTLTAAGRSPIQPQPAAAPTAARPPLKSASAPKLAGGGATLQQTASPLVLQAARSSGGNNLRLCLIAMLSERAMPKGAVMSGGCPPNSLAPLGVVRLPSHACPHGPARTCLPVSCCRLRLLRLAAGLSQPPLAVSIALLQCWQMLRLACLASSPPSRRLIRC
jgi:hypothetical protein